MNTEGVQKSSVKSMQCRSITKDVTEEMKHAIEILQTQAIAEGIKVRMCHVRRYMVKQVEGDGKMHS